MSITNTSLSWGECCSSLSEYVALCLWFLVCFVHSTWMESNPVILGMDFHYAWSRVRSINGRFGKMMIFFALLSVRIHWKVCWIHYDRDESYMNIKHARTQLQGAYSWSQWLYEGNLYKQGNSPYGNRSRLNPLDRHEIIWKETPGFLSSWINCIVSVVSLYLSDLVGRMTRAAVYNLSNIFLWSQASPFQYGCTNLPIVRTE